ncbi:MAG: hypothetical protein K2O84_08550 [Oscillospiraceae bacterium]|nr:hypothetical protein [Oscillospiraceae bacterium]
MWKKLKSPLKERPRKRRINMSKEKDYEYLLHTLGIPEEPGFINVDESDILQLKCGKAVFLYESPLVFSAEDGIAMAKKAARKMMPAPGRAVLLTVLMIIADYECDLDLIGQITNLLTEEAFLEDTDMIFGVRFSDEKGIRFVMATAEGKHGSKPFCVDDSLEAPALDNTEMRETLSPPGLSDAELIDAAAEVALETGHITVAMLQRRFKLVYSHACALLEWMEKFELISPLDSEKPWRLLMSPAQWKAVRERMTPDNLSIMEELYEG